MLKTLLRVQLASLKNQLTGGSRRKQKPGKGRALLLVVLLLYAFGTFGFLFYENFSALAAAFHGVGLDWLFFSMAGLMCFGLMFVGSVFTAKAQLYEAKDNDLLLSMPIRPRDILISRMLLLWLITMFFGLIVSMPVLLAWQSAAGFTAGQLVVYLLQFVLLLPLLSLTISALFGWVLHLVTSHVGKKSLVTVVLSLIFLGLYMYVVMQMNTLVQRLAENASAAAQKLGAVAPVYFFGLAVAEKKPGVLLLIAVVILGLFALSCALLARTFIKTATDRRGSTKKKYVERRASALSPQRALLQRELRHFLASPSYILNAGLGAIMTLIAAGFLLVERRQIAGLLAVEGVGQLLPWLFIMGLCFCAGMSLVTAPSISLEGKSLWIVKSFPLDTRDVLRAKLRLHILITLPPSFLASAAVLFIVRAPWPTLLCILLIPALFCLFSGLLGLAENLRHPNFDWINETQAVKSGVSVMLTMFVLWGVLVVPVLAFAFLGDMVAPQLLGLGFAALLAVICALLYRWLMHSGARLFDAL